MLIDDDKSTNSLNRGFLEDMGYCNYVIKKESALQGIAYLTKSNDRRNNLPFPELIFLDIHMRDIDGWEFLKYFAPLKNNLINIPVIYMLSSFVLEQDFVDLSNSINLAGMCEKPLSKTTLNAIINKHFIFQ